MLSFSRAWKMVTLVKNPVSDQSPQARKSAGNMCFTASWITLPPLKFLYVRHPLYSEHGIVMTDINELIDKINTKTLNIVLLSIAT